MKTLIIFISLFMFLDANSIQKIEKEITKTQKEIQEKAQKAKTIQLSLEELGKTILKKQNYLNKLSKKISKLKLQIEKNKTNVKQKEEKIKNLKEKKKKLLHKKSIVERKLVDIIIKDLSFNLISSSQEPSKEEDIVFEAVYEKLSKIAKKESKKYQEQFISFEQNIGMLNKEIDILEKEINKLSSSKKELEKLKKEEQEKIAKLDYEKAMYKKRLQKIIDEQKSRTTLLNVLKITKQKAIEKERKKREEELKRKQQKLKADNIKIRQIGSSYQATKKKRYKGKKVRAPLESFSVIKKFGPYVDPVYHIKIHNDSITMLSKKKNAIVRNIMDGKVIIAKDISMLGKTVIIKHANNLHSIYSNLSKIAPGIKPGRFIKKRNAIGRIKSELKFEITKEDVPINPFEVIKSK